MQNKKIITFIVILFLSLGIFSDTKAITIAELQAQIATLATQLTTLQAQLAQMQKDATTWCHNFNTNLSQDSSGSEVEALQIALEKEFFTIGINEKTNKYFGESTRLAVIGFQEKYAANILTPLGLTHGTGYVGIATRSKLNSLYGCQSTITTPSTTAAITPPTVTTSVYTNVAYSSATLNGNITSTNGQNADLRGFDIGNIYGTYNLTGYTEGIAGSYAYGIGAFSWTSLSLNPGTTYYIRAKAHNSAGWNYGQMWTFNTSATSCTHIAPTVTLTPVTQSGSPGKLLVYNVGIKNNNLTNGCAPAEINLSVTTCPSGWTCSLGLSSVLEQPISAATGVGLHITPPVGASAGLYNITVQIAYVSSSLKTTQTLTTVYNVVSTTTPPAPILSPVGGETWQRGTSQVIRWTPYEKPSSSVIISLYKEGIYQKPLAGAIPDSYGQWIWNIPADQPLGSLYSIRVSRLSYPQDFVADSNYFSIIEKLFITLLSPNGGETWKAEDTHDITWKSSGLDKIYIGVRCSEGGLVPLFSTPNIAREVSASLGKFSWKIDVSSIIMCDKYKVTVGSAIQTGKAEAISGTYDESDNGFTVTASDTNYKCPDLNGDKKIDILDAIIISNSINTCSGNAKYDARGDVNGDNCVNSIDQNYIPKYMGYNLADLIQCQNASSLNTIQKMMASIADTISKLLEGIRSLGK